MGATDIAKKFIRSFRESRAKKSVFHQLREYRGHVHIRHETDDFLVKTAASGRELVSILEMRHEIFVKGWQGRSFLHGLDLDDFDMRADHLMIVDKRSDDIVGTYRLMSSHFVRDFYSSGEFDLGEFLKTPGVKLEMGRACIRPEFRDGNTIDLLWKGLARYIFATRTDILFGCTSLSSLDPQRVSRLVKGLMEDGDWNDDFSIRPAPDYTLPQFTVEGASALPAHERRALVPPLLRSYLHAGAKVHGWPALDREFGCVDLLTILDWNQLNPKFRSRFLKF